VGVDRCFLDDVVGRARRFVLPMGVLIVGDV